MASQKASSVVYSCYRPAQRVDYKSIFDLAYNSVIAVPGGGTPEIFG